MQEKLIVGLIGVVTGFLGALLKSWLDSRLLLDTETRKERWTVYKVLWDSMKAVPKWPRDREPAGTGISPREVSTSPDRPRRLMAECRTP